MVDIRDYIEEGVLNRTETIEGMKGELTAERAAELIAGMVTKLNEVKNGRDRLGTKIQIGDVIITEDEPSGLIVGIVESISDRQVKFCTRYRSHIIHTLTAPYKVLVLNQEQIQSLQ